MPRHANPANNAQQERTRRWREKLDQSGIPESDAVDEAVSAAVTAVTTAMRLQGNLTEERKAVIGAITEATVRLLVNRGYTEAGARKVLIRRLSRWQSHAAQRDLIRQAGINLRTPVKPSGNKV